MINSNIIKIYCFNKLSLEDYKVLNLLYQPLIGTIAISLYNILYFLNESKNNFDNNFNITHQMLFDLLNVDQKTFKKNKYKLEALRLLETYSNENKDIIYIMHSPVQVHNFFKDPLLSHFFLSEVGNYYHCLQKLLLNKSPIIPANFQNISKNFVDIYGVNKIAIDHSSLYNHYSSDNVTMPPKHLVVFKKFFDYEMFLSNLSERFKKPFLLENENIDYIVTLGFVYMLKPKEMAILYQKLFRHNYNQNIDLNILKDYLYEQNVKTQQNIKIIDATDYQQEKNEMILCLKRSHPINIIKSFGKNINMHKRLNHDLFMLIQNNKNVDIGVINALLMYICKKKNHDIHFVLSYNYCNTVLKSWLKRGIVSTETAYNYLTAELTNHINKFNSSRKEVALPKWLDDFMKNLH
ncbi:MAG: DnaD domain protein [Candidatus Phytoplasma australasiaticum]|uniref:DnaD domain protein n=2 Tax=16SrII (Peanut WB group) TaxID=85621 RepID=A0A9K3SUQ0_9MOLU|nr:MULTISPECIES: DnaD domain protein [Phytoplasma]MCG3566937.1 DnaD domain protein [Sesame phyllody phytoplasma]MDO8031306.1 DnaD domain protein [Candidatus Phytoplasma australasiaticum]MDO8031656.1 DnaD domain protein [Candidatus Phytoplasma australasiaticum]MDO8046811.1 DnaD domain protein [Candidatus Phytoplasma australasiaticum]MDO8053369.1 DnaD domain protein [Candidatus Phytoplasma australasiaticum]